MENHILLVITLACSFLMALPISTPPNAIAFSTNMLKSWDLIKAGAIISSVCLIVTLIVIEFILLWGLK